MGAPSVRLRVAATLAVVVVGSAGMSACRKHGTGRPSTSAQLVIVSPTPNEVTGPNVTLQVSLTGAQVVPASTGPLRGDQGHIHVWIGDKLVSMAYGTSQTLPNVAPGRHSLFAEFVATDHLPFANRLRAVVIFTVQG